MKHQLQPNVNHYQTALSQILFSFFFYIYVFFSISFLKIIVMAFFKVQ